EALCTSVDFFSSSFDTSVIGSTSQERKVDAYLEGLFEIHYQLGIKIIPSVAIKQDLNKNLYTVEANNARQLVESAAQDIEKLLSNRSTALVVSGTSPFLVPILKMDT
uniref:Uncharacterized protein n=1 Tax=Laticauda laticaudata TaxID=8630 RepID=A0A8C5SZ83_LATLA